MNKSPRQRFNEKCLWRDSGCLIWTGAVRGSRQKRGCFWDGKKTVDAARWQLTNLVRPPKEDECACHTCDNSLCVNVEHLFWATHQENVADMHAKQRSHHYTDPSVGKQAGAKSQATFRQKPHLRARGSRHGSAKLTEDQASAIQNSALPSEWLAKVHGVSRSTINRIRNGSLWSAAIKARQESPGN